MESIKLKPKKYVKKIKEKIEEEEEEPAKIKIIPDKYNNYKYLLSLKQFVLQ